MENNNINDILGIDDSKRQSNNENRNSINSADIPVLKIENESFANGLNIVGIILYIIGVVVAIYLFYKLASGWSDEIDEDNVPKALLISVFVLFYHIVFGLICQGISKVLANIRK